MPPIQPTRITTPSDLEIDLEQSGFEIGRAHV